MSVSKGINFEAAFAALTGHEPMAWQRRLYGDCFARGSVPSAIDLPTGLGKTSVMAIWLIAVTHGAPLPRRLVYVVDRRVVVDQATSEAEKLQTNAKAALGIDRLPISTLRGGHAEDRGWLYDAAAPAIIVGTVDLIGSRLLFSGYRMGRWSRPWQAGLLGSDCLIVLDEAHLSPAFEHAVSRVLALRKDKDDTPAPIPPLRLLPLSATPGMAGEDGVFRLTETDYQDATVRRRTGRERPTKRLRFAGLADSKDGLSEALAEAAAAHDGAKRAVLVYCHSRGVAKKAADRLRDLLQPAKERREDVELIIGARRGCERDRLTQTDTYCAFGPPENAGDAARKRPADGRTRYLVCTAAGEVGADLDADAAAMDLVPLERMVQRLGRVNRRGDSADPAPVTIFSNPRDLVAGASDKPEKQAEAARLAASKSALIERLPVLGDGERDGSPEAIGRMLPGLGKDGREAASTAWPKIPSIEPEHVEAWALTSLKDHPGRPDVAPFIRGIETDDEPQTTVAWRVDVPFLARLPGTMIERALDAVPLRPVEALEAPTREVVDVLRKRIAAIRKGWDRAEPDGTAPGDPRCMMLVRRRSGTVIGEVLRDSFRLGAEEVDCDDTRSMIRRLAGATLLLDPALGGLDEDGTLYDRPPLLPDGEDETEPFERWARMHVEPDALIRLIRGTAPENAAACFERLAIPSGLRESNPDLAADIVVRAARDEQLAGWRRRWSCPLPSDAADEDAEDDRLEYWSQRWDVDGETAAAKKKQLLEEHHHCAGKEMRRVAAALGLDAPLVECLVCAIELHDFGKDRARWQRWAGAPRDGRGPYAKTVGRGFGNLHGYRHEFGSLRDALDPGLYGDRLQALDERYRELALHLIAAHHGRARPFIPAIDENERDVFGTILPETTFEAAQRYVRLQRKWGPWGLAWLEALLRAADAAVSRKLDELGP